MSMKKTAALLLALCLMLLPVFGVSAEGQEACLLSDCERFAEDGDTLFEWGLFNNDDRLGELHLDTSSALQGQNSMRFDYDVWGEGGGWTRCIFFPDLQSMTVGDGLKFSAKATGNIKMYVVISIDWKAKWIPVTLTPEAREYTIIWDEAEEMEGTAPYSAKGATLVNSLSFLIYDPCYIESQGHAQFPTIQTKGSIWLDDLYTFVGEDTTDTDGKVFTAPKPTRPGDDDYDDIPDDGDRARRHHCERGAGRDHDERPVRQSDAGGQHDGGQHDHPCQCHHGRQ